MKKPVMILILLLSIQLVVKSQTSAPPGAPCMYNLMVPETNLEKTCSAFNKQKMEQLTYKVIELESKVNTYKTHLSESAHVAPTKLHNPAFRCECQTNNTFHFEFRDCHDVGTLTKGPSGWYQVTPVNSTGHLLAYDGTGESQGSSAYWFVHTYAPIKVYCKIQGGEGWTMIMRRKHMDVSFDQDWQEYKDGFGDMNDKGDFWLGLENMHQLTSQKYTTYMLWVVLSDEHQVPYVYPYQQFKVLGEATNYTLQVSGFQGKLGDMLTASNNKPFITKDHDRNATTSTGTYDSYRGRYTTTSTYSATCPISNSVTGGGGWWFSAYMSTRGSASEKCGDTNLNARVPYWPYTSGSTGSEIASVTMMIKPVKQ